MLSVVHGLPHSIHTTLSTVVPPVEFISKPRFRQVDWQWQLKAGRLTSESELCCRCCYCRWHGKPQDMNVSLVSSITYGILISQRKMQLNVYHLHEKLLEIMQVLYLKVRERLLLISHSSVMSTKNCLNIGNS